MIDPVTLKALASGGTGAAIPIVMMYALFTPNQDFTSHVAESLRGGILDLVAQAHDEEPGPFKDALCKSLEQQIAELCTSAPNDSLCTDRSILREKAGCS